LRKVYTPESIALKDDDFPLLREAASTVASLAAGTVLHAWAPAALASLVVLLYQYRKVRIVLTPTQVRELKRRPSGMSAEDIALLLEVTPQEALKELQSLQTIRRGDGKIESIVSVDTNSIWQAVGV
jgi:hypothetical protein